MILLVLLGAGALAVYAVLVLALCRMAARADIDLGFKQEIGERPFGRSRRSVSRTRPHLQPAHRGVSGVVVDLADYSASRASARAGGHRRTA